MEFKEINFYQYEMLLDSSCKCPLSDYYVSVTRNGNGKVYALIEDNSIISYAIAFLQSGELLIAYVYTIEKSRQNGYAEKIIKNIISTETEFPFIRVHITSSHDYFNAVKRICDNIGFINAKESYVYSFAIDQKFWIRLNELKVMRMKDILLSGGFECVSFSHMSEDIFKQIINSPNSEYKNSLNPKDYIENSNTHVDYDLSFAMVKDNLLCAYSMITLINSDTICVEQISEAESRIGSGIIIAPLCASFEEIKKRTNIKRMNLTIYEENDKSKDFVMGLLENGIIKKTQNINYWYRQDVNSPISI